MDKCTLTSPNPLDAPILGRLKTLMKLFANTLANDEVFNYSMYEKGQYFKQNIQIQCSVSSCVCTGFCPPPALTKQLLSPVCISLRTANPTGGLSASADIPRALSGS